MPLLHLAATEIAKRGVQGLSDCRRGRRSWNRMEDEMPGKQRAAASRQHRTLFLSDLHLGAIGGRADLVLRFLRANRAETYVLVGDILDVWYPVLPHWNSAHQGVIDHLRRRHAEGARIIYIRGNHDPLPETAPDQRRLPVEAQDRIIHEAADGRRFLVTHGDIADRRAFRSSVMTRIGSRLDQDLRRLDRGLRRRLRRLKEPHRRTAIEWVLFGVNALFYPDRAHERRLVAVARVEGLDGVICGHFHIAALHDRHGLTYANCGDWMDSFTALAEDHEGRLQMLGGRAAFARAPRPIPALGAVRA